MKRYASYRTVCPLTAIFCIVNATLISCFCESFVSLLRSFSIFRFSACCFLVFLSVRLSVCESCAPCSPCTEGDLIECCRSSSCSGQIRCEETNAERRSPQDLRQSFLESSPRMRRYSCRRTAMNHRSLRTPSMLRRQAGHILDSQQLCCLQICWESIVDRQNHLQQRKPGRE